MARAQKGAEQLLAAAGLGEPAIAQVVESILAVNEREAARAGVPVAVRAPEATPTVEPAPSEPPLSTPAASSPALAAAAPAPPGAVEAVDAEAVDGRALDTEAVDAEPDEPGEEREPEPDR